VRAESLEPDTAAMLASPSIEMPADEANPVPQHACGAHHAAALQFDRRRRDLDHAGVEVDRAARREVV
jgi:hypothetical protein